MWTSIISLQSLYQINKSIMNNLSLNQLQRRSLKDYKVPHLHLNLKLSRDSRPPYLKIIQKFIYKKDKLLLMKRTRIIRVEKNLNISMCRSQASLKKLHQNIKSLIIRKFLQLLSKLIKSLVYKTSLSLNKLMRKYLKDYKVHLIRLSPSSSQDHKFLILIEITCLQLIKIQLRNYLTRFLLNQSSIFRRIS